MHVSQELDAKASQVSIGLLDCNGKPTFLPLVLPTDIDRRLRFQEPS